MTVYKRIISIQSCLFPCFCVLCGDRSPRRDPFCPACRQGLPRLDTACARCAAPLPPEAPLAGTCGHCQRESPAYDRIVAAFRYAPPLDRLIQGGKYHGRLDWLDVLGRELAGRLVDRASEIDALVPVPLHRTRLRERGYNQSLELARALARRLRLPIVTSGVRRARATLPQTGLSRELRRKNVRHAFSLECRFDERRVAIVDDVMTSGATIESLAQALRQAGAKQVEAWVLARAG